MDYTLEIIIDEQAKQPRLVLYTAEITDEVRQLTKQLSLQLGAQQGTDARSDGRLLGYREEDVVLLSPDEVYCFFTQGQTVQARLKDSTVRVKHRLYELEEALAGTSFIRISNAEIVNFKKVRSFELSIAGNIGLRLSDGSYSYVSRRRAKAIKEYLGIANPRK
ncbi:MAG: LytTR family transcriptional regulator [Coriobacteriales bacterium]|jgi:DNA-binding LytR/AlgR family response regulator|nr:LytTR family transcriptional regulator [Coriobacteriales bacterium]